MTKQQKYFFTNSNRAESEKNFIRNLTCLENEHYFFVRIHFFPILLPKSSYFSN